MCVINELQSQKPPHVHAVNATEMALPCQLNHTDNTESNSAAADQ